MNQDATLHFLKLIKMGGGWWGKESVITAFMNWKQKQSHPEKKYNLVPNQLAD